MAGRHPILGRVAFYSLVVLGLVPLVFSHVMTRPFRQPTSPPRAGFTSGNVVSDGLRLRTWTRPGSPSLPAVVIVHGVGDSLESFVDLGLGFAARGHTVLLLDTRGHGGSEGNRITLGAREREDVRAAMDRLGRDGMASSGLLLVGHSMGAVAVLRAAAGRPDVRAVIVEAPYDTFRETIARHAWLFYGFPRWVPLIPLSIAITEWRGGFDADEVDAVAAAAQVRGALLAIADGADVRMPEAVVRRVFDAHPGPKRMWVAPDAGHVGASLHPDYWPTVTAFLVENGIWGEVPATLVWLSKGKRTGTETETGAEREQPARPRLGERVMAPSRRLQGWRRRARVMAMLTSGGPLARTSRAPSLSRRSQLNAVLGADIRAVRGAPFPLAVVPRHNRASGPAYRRAGLRRVICGD